MHKIGEPWWIFWGVISRKFHFFHRFEPFLLSWGMAGEEKRIMGKERYGLKFLTQIYSQFSVGIGFQVSNFSLSSVTETPDLLKFLISVFPENQPKSWEPHSMVYPQMEFFGSAEREKATLGIQFELGSNSRLGAGNVRAGIPGIFSTLDYSMIRTSLPVRS